MPHAHLADAAWIDGALVRDVLVTVGDDGRIASVGRAEAAGDATIERLRGRVLLPGFVNAHSHAFQRLIRGRTEANPPGRRDGDFWVWREAMYRAVDRLTPEAMEAVARFAFVEMASAGWTHVGEFHYVHHQPGGAPYDDPNEMAKRVLAAAEYAGIGITLLRTAYQRGGAGRAAAGGQLRFVDSPAAFARAIQDLRGDPDARRPVRVGVAAHSVRALDAGYLRFLRDVAAGRIVHAHVSEQPREIEECLAEHGLRPVELLDDCGLLSPRFTAVHATHLGPGEAARLGRAGASACICPTTERNLGDGLPDLLELYSEGVRISVGTDSHARIDPFAELRGLEDGERLRSGRRVALAAEGGTTAEVVLAAGTRGGAECLDLDAGAIEVGRRADLVTVRVDDLAFAGARDPETLAGALVLGADARSVEDVWVGGRRVVEGGRHPRAAEARRGFEAVVADLYD